MSVTELPIVNEEILLQFEKEELPIVITDSGISTDDKPTQSANAELPMSVTELPIINDETLLQPKNADCPIVKTESGIKIEDKFVQLQNALSGMLSTPSPMFNSVMIEKADGDIVEQFFAL